MLGRHWIIFVIGKKKLEKTQLSYISRSCSHLDKWHMQHYLGWNIEPDELDSLKDGKIDRT
jgi:hypothetical protein